MFQQGEIQYVLKAGCTPDRIIFANPNITTRGLKYAKQVGVDLLTFDSEVQLRKIHNVYPNSRWVQTFLKLIYNFSRSVKIYYIKKKSKVNSCKLEWFYKKVATYAENACSNGIYVSDVIVQCWQYFDLPECQYALS